MWRKIEIFEIAAFLACLLTASQAGVCLADLPAAVGNLLCDYGFERSEPNGGFPDSACWSSYVMGYGGAGCTTTAARLGDNGLWQYTGLATTDRQSLVYQDIPAASGRRFFASAWVRTTFTDSQWVDGSKAFVKLNFLDASKNSLAEYNSSVVDSADADWMLLYFATYPAPAHTRYVRFALCVEKPQSVGQTIVNFDDCILREIESADSIRLDEIPPCGSTELLRGSVVGVNPDDYRVGVYIFVDDWWPKPTFTLPWTDIDSHGNWHCDISKTIDDLNATEVMAFLVPKNEISDWPVDFDNHTGLSALPGEAFRFPVVGSFRPSCFSTVSFAGYNWLVKDSGTRTVGPGPNLFDSDNVWVDADGYLHLKITNEAGQWRCAEVFSENSFGGGTYKFEVQNNIASLDPNVILGLFTWDEFAPHYTNREIDVEIGKWSDSAADNAQYVVQPWNKAGHRHRFNIDPYDTDSLTTAFDWGFNRVAFGTFFGPIASADSDLIDSWVYQASDVPRPGNENVRINLWLNNGRASYYGDEAEVVIKDFEVNACSYEISPDALDFNSVLISKAATRVITIANTRQCLPYLVSVEVNGADADNFLVADRAFSLEPGCDKQVDVVFIPAAASVYNATLQITSSTGVVNVPLTARGVRIGYTRVPPVGSPDFLEGIVSGVKFSDYRVVSYLFVFDKWYIKPLCVSRKAATKPLVKISRAGDWLCDVDVEVTDKAATQVASFLVPKEFDNPPCILDSLDDPRLSSYDHISAERPTLSISSVKAKTGAADGGDSLQIDGQYYITMDQLLSADRLCLSVLHNRGLVWNICVPFDADKFMSRGWFIYEKAGVHVKLKNTAVLLNSYAGQLRIVLDSEDLTCLDSPVTVAVLLGGFDECANADEELQPDIINGKQAIPIQFLSGCTDSVRIDKLTLKNGSKQDSVNVKGAIVCKNEPPDLTVEDFSMGWGSDTFTLPAGAFKRIGKTQPKFQCKKAKSNEGGVIDAILNFKTNSFQIKLTDTKLDTASDTIPFNLVMGNFSEGVSVKTGQ